MIRRLLLAGVLALLASCTGKLPLQYGEALCDSARPCPEGFSCQDSVCVPSSGDGDAVVTPDEDAPFVGDWDGPVGTPADLDPESFCRTDAQCDPDFACVGAQCLERPCAGASCGAGQQCIFQCLPTAAACDGVECAENVEYCVAGVCQPTCVPDPCEGVSCPGGQLCFAGACRPVVPCDDRFCPAGFECSLSCATPSPCSPNPCSPGWSCRVDENQQAQCVPNECSGLTCMPGESCIQGECIDTCANIPCEDGGRLCANGAACCSRVCCDSGQVCRQGQCLLPELVCNPPCAANQLCVGSECWCARPAAQGGAERCDANECCLGAGAATACDDPCSPNPCAADVQNPLCVRDCAQALGYRCGNDCGDVTCTLPNTTCDPADGQCRCGPTAQVCSGGTCCLPVGSGGALTCDNPCSPNPCTGEPQNKGCRVACTASSGLGFTCYDLCAGKSCVPGAACDPVDGVCKCNGDPCGSSECCVTAGVPSPECKDPCNPSPCGVQQCVRDCSEPDGFRCQDNCAAGACSTDYRNPDCQPSTGACRCSPDNLTFDLCTSSECCVDGLCDEPCVPDPCAAGATSGDTRCTVSCTSGTTDYTCSDPCSGNSCATSAGGRNPDCRSSSGAGQNAECYCSVAGVVCTSAQCCSGSGCLDPCSPDPCAAGASSGNTRCNRDCGRAGDYYCSDPCSGNACATSDNGRNPDCRSTGAAGDSSQCYCAAASAACGAGQCCGGAGCYDPCAGGGGCGTLACVVDCRATGGRVCTNNCGPTSCQDPREPDCTPATGACTCGGVDCGGTNCCVDSNANGSRDACLDPCSPNPCVSDPTNKKCVRDCAQLDGFACQSFCSGVTCSDPLRNPTCDPADGVCGCGTSYALCGGGQYCCNNGGDKECRNPACTASSCAAESAGCTVPKTCDPCVGCAGGEGCP